MRLLFLGNSNDAGTWFEGGKKRHEIVAERLEAEFGEPFDVTVKTLWPSAELPTIVAGWVEKYRPDLIYIDTASFWFLYRSVPLRVQRLLGKAGPKVGEAGFKVANSKRWSHNALFRKTRGFLQATIGGDTHFTADEVQERISECIRIAVRAENAAVAVKGPHGKLNHARTKRGFLKDEKKRIRVHRAWEALCEQLHVTYEGKLNPALYETDYRKHTVGDGLHSDATRHALDSESLYQTLRAALISAGHEPVRPGQEAARV